MTTSTMRPGEYEAMLQARLAEIQARKQIDARRQAPPVRRQRRSIPRAASGLVSLATVAILLTTVALGTHDFDLLELDGNTADGVATGVDWDSLFTSGGSAADAYVYLEDPFDAALDDIFTGGSTKDIHDIDEWLWKPSQPQPDKDDIENAAAAAFSYAGPAVCGPDDGDPDTPEFCTNPGDQILYFAADRFTVQGTSFIGFWFLQNEVTQTDVASQGGFLFGGVHEEGDILAVIEYTNGGSVTSMKIWKWVASCVDPDPSDSVDPCVDDNLFEIFSGVDCLDTAPEDPACARSNRADDGTVNPEWPYTPKGGDPDDPYPVGAFVEGGINLTALGVDVGCLSSFLAETRSSSVPTATLKDKALGHFDVCEISVDKSGDTVGKVGDPAHYVVTITNDSVGATLYKDSVIDSVFGDITTDPGAPLSGYTSDCGVSLAAGDSCTIEFDYTVQGGDPDPLDNTVTVTYNDEADFSGAELTDSDDHSLQLFQPSLTIDKTGTEFSKVGDEVTYDYTITNTSSADSPNLILDSLMDTGDNNGGAGLGDLTGLTGYDTDCDELAPTDVCTFSISYTVLAGDDDPLDNTVVAHYHPDGFSNDITDDDSHQVLLFVPSLTIDKTGTELSKVGDEVTYDYTITNTSSADSPNLILDSLMDTGDNNGGAGLLGPGDDDVTNAPYVVQVGDPDPLLNTASVTCTVVGFTNVLGPLTEGHSVDLFQPAVTIDKTGPTEASVGELVTYSFTITNTSSADSPDLILASVLDTVIGDITADATAGGCGTLAPAGVCNFTADYTIQGTDPTPLVNVVTALYHPEGFPNDVTATDDHSLEIVGGEGCTPGFWQGGFGSQLWNVLNDPDWTAAGGVGTNPYAHDTLFNSFFTAHSSLNGLTMLDIVGTGGGSAWPRKTARDVVAAYLNTSFGLDYPFTADEIWNMWDAAVTLGTTSAFRSLHLTLDEANNLGCPIGQPIVIVTPIGLIPVGGVSLAAIYVGARRMVRRIRACTA